MQSNNEQKKGLGDLSFPKDKNFYQTEALENSLIFVVLCIAIIAALYILHSQITHII